MSWFFAVPASPVADFDVAATTAKDAYTKALEGNDYALDQIASGQFDEAIKAASALVASGVVGSDKVQATLTGHANPNHLPAAGYANEILTVSLSAVTSTPAA